MNVTFTPSAAGQRFAEIQIEFNGASSPLKADLTGEGNEPPACPEFTTGTPPDCDPIPCPANFTGNEPDCEPIPCPAGFTGNEPDCEPIPCPAGFTGNEPDCEPIPCPAGFTGNEPDCVELKARISKLTVTGPAKIRKGKPATYKARITNSGNARANGVKLVASGKGIRSKVLVGTINPGATRTVNLRIRPSRTGRIKATFKVVSGNAGTKTVKRRITVRK